MYGTIAFPGKIVMIGFGAVGKVLLYMLLKVVKIDRSKVTVVDRLDMQEVLQRDYYRGVRFARSQVDRNNYLQVLEGLSKGDLLIDVANGVSTVALLAFCSSRGCDFISSAMQDWADQPVPKDPSRQTLTAMHKELDGFNRGAHKTGTWLVSMGCNPGNVSIWTKMGLRLINDRPIKGESFADVSRRLGVQTIHISEKDTQITKQPKRDDEYCNTWSSDGESFYAEAMAAAEVAWGTHERSPPTHTWQQQDGMLVRSVRGMHTNVRSLTPYGQFTGSVFCHDEAFTIARNLSVRNGEVISYRPSVYYVYSRYVNPVGS